MGDLFKALSLALPPSPSCFFGPRSDHIWFRANPNQLCSCLVGMKTCSHSDPLLDQFDTTGLEAGARGGSPDWIWLRAWGHGSVAELDWTCRTQGSHTLKHTLIYLYYFRVFFLCKYILSFWNWCLCQKESKNVRLKRQIKTTNHVMRNQHHVTSKENGRPVDCHLSHTKLYRQYDKLSNYRCLYQLVCLQLCSCNILMHYYRLDWNPGTVSWDDPLNVTSL